MVFYCFLLDFVLKVSPQKMSVSNSKRNYKNLRFGMVSNFIIELISPLYYLIIIKYLLSENRKFNTFYKLILLQRLFSMKHIE